MIQLKYMPILVLHDFINKTMFSLKKIEIIINTADKLKVLSNNQV